ncbi:MAG: hypothetical protein NW224_11850 [Leptolyngbyaceae cyanobacterium bins.302]|nr:hypothetical protein [Leptolyngbyaceae cyanobacterium bins.302]
MEQPPIASPVESRSDRVPFEPRSQRSQPRASDATLLRWFGYLLETRPMAFWGGVWVSVFLIAVVAFGSLLSPSAAERRSVSAIALGSDSGVATQPLESRGKVPLWMFGAIAITCTAGSILVSRQLQPHTSRPVPASHPVPPRRVKPKHHTAQPQARVPGNKKRAKPAAQPPKRLKPYSATDPLLTQPQSIQAQFVEAQLTPAQLTQAQREKSASAASQQLTSQQLTKNNSTHQPSGLNQQPVTTAAPRGQTVAHSPSFVVAKSVKVPVTVVPADQVHPLDWDQPRLADAVDLRKRKSIQSLL